MSCKCPLFPPATEDFSHLKANERILNFKPAYPTSVYVFKVVLVVPGLTYASFMAILRVLGEPVRHFSCFGSAGLKKMADEKTK